MSIWRWADWLDAVPENARVTLANLLNSQIACSGSQTAQALHDCGRNRRWIGTRELDLLSDRVAKPLNQRKS